MKKILFIYEFMDLGYEVIEQAGVECLAAYMNGRNWDVDVFNTVYEIELENKIIEYKPDIIGVSVTTPTVVKTISSLKDIKNKLDNVKILVGGVGASIEPENILNDFAIVDAVLVGEGEETLFEVSEKLLAGECLDNVKGIVYRKNEQIIKTEKRVLISDLDELPIPLHIGYEKYKDNRNLKYITLVTSRGCYGNCSFCARNFKNQKGSIVRNRSAELVVHEIQDCIKRFGVHRFAFCDQTFEDACPIGKDRINRIADLIIEKDLDIIFTIHIRSENWKEVDTDLVYKLRKAGLVGIYPGVESVDDETLKIYNKYAREKDHVTALNLFSKIDVAIDMGFIMFNPYTTVECITKNFEFIKQMNVGNLGHIFFNNLILFPGVAIVDQLRFDNLLLMEPSYRNFEEAQYAYTYKDSRIQYLFENVFTNKNKEKLCSGKVYILTIGWQVFISIAKLKLNKEIYRQELEHVESEYISMKKFFHEKYCEIFQSFIEVADDMNIDLVKIEDLNSAYEEFNSIFQSCKMKIFKKATKLNDVFCSRFYNY